MIHRFDLWKHRVDQILQQQTGLTADDFEDWCWRDSFNSGDLPTEAVEAFLEEMMHV